MKISIVLGMVLLLAPVGGIAADHTSGPDPTEPIHMEAMEVRGVRERLEGLYLPVSKRVSVSSPVRFDLFLADMAHPVTPSTLDSEAIHSTGTTEGRQTH